MAINIKLKWKKREEGKYYSIMNGVEWEIERVGGSKCNIYRNGVLVSKSNQGVKGAEELVKRFIYKESNEALDTILTEKMSTLSDLANNLSIILKDTELQELSTKTKKRINSYIDKEITNINKMLDDLE